MVGSGGGEEGGAEPGGACRLSPAALSAPLVCPGGFLRAVVSVGGWFVPTAFPGGHFQGRKAGLLGC